MAIDFIAIDRNVSTATYASEILQFKNKLKEAYQQGKYLLTVMGHNNDGTNFAPIETLFGIPTGSGNTVYDLLNGTIGSMEGTFQVSDAKTFIEKVG